VTRSTITHLWAKRSGDDVGAAEHPLICHMLDVGAVAEALVREVLPSGSLRWLGDGIGCDPDDSASWIGLLAALHDLGKANPLFQQRRPGQSRIAPHGFVTARVLPDILAGHSFGLERTTARRLAAITGGHHGVLPSPLQLRELPAVIDDRPWPDVRAALVEALLASFPVEGALQSPDPARSMWLAGLISVADWIGSNTDFFPLRSDLVGVDGLDTTAYRRDYADGGAHRALETLGWLDRPAATSPASFSTLFPAIETPNALQQRAADLAARLDRPGLILIEAPMGEGKTEAALHLADSAIARQGLRGAYVALPTMATSNQMFSRVHQFLSARYPTAVQAQLLHGHASLSAELEALEANFDAWRSFLEHIDAPPDDEPGTSVVASSWFTQRKRGLLSPFGVGTIDQALLGVLQTRHVFVRLFGLANRVVIVDEVHAYDTYMSTLLQRLIAWLQHLGSTVVLLSATLPDALRRALLATWQPDMGESGTTLPEVVGYPRLTWRIGDDRGSCSFPVSNRGRKRLEIVGLPHDAAADLPQRVANAVEGGGCVAVICTTVPRAQDVYRVFQDSGLFRRDEIDLFHARFPMDERLQRERRALAKFGRDGKHRPRRAVLIATQVIEQSLDLDFDLMITDLAPIDLLLQRSGRLHRHDRAGRPARLARPELWIRAPSQSGDEQARFDRDEQAVYDEHILLRTWETLRDQSVIMVPDELDHLIEAVYGPLTDAERADSGSRLELTRQRMVADLEQQRSLAMDRVLKPPTMRGHPWELAPEPRAEDQPEIALALQALTRLTEPSVTIVCHRGPLHAARLHDGAPLDLESAPERHIKSLLLATVTISHRSVVGAISNEGLPPMWGKHALLRSLRPVSFDDHGVAVRDRYRLTLDPDLGLCIDKEV
jgi:CRISPR-associated endonuclease/helicase Cas3